MKITMLIFILCVALPTVVESAAPNPLIADPPLTLPGPAGRFDFMDTDSSQKRILAAHKGAKSLEVLDLASGKTLKSVEVGEAQGVAIDVEGHRYFLGNESDHSIAFVDSKTLSKIEEVRVDGPVDAIAYDDKNGMLYAAEDDGDHLWVIDTKNPKVVGTIAIPGVPEVLAFDPITNSLYLNIKNKDKVVRIDPKTNKVDATWSTLPATSPHGLVVDSKRGRVYSAGGNGKIVAINLKTGENLGSADIAPKVDQIAFDAERGLVYSACKGFISVTKVTDAGLQKVSEVPSPKGAHTLAIDPLTHGVWVSFSDDSHSYFQKFKVQTK